MVTVYFGPTPVEEALVQVRELKNAGDPYVQVVGESLEGALEAMTGRFERARELNRRADAFLEELGLQMRRAFVTFQAVDIELLAGDAAAAEERGRNGLEILQRQVTRASPRRSPCSSPRRSTGRGGSRRRSAKGITVEVERAKRILSGLTG